MFAAATPTPTLPRLRGRGLDAGAKRVRVGAGIR